MLDDRMPPPPRHEMAAAAATSTTQISVKSQPIRFMAPYFPLPTRAMYYTYYNNNNTWFKCPEN